MTRETGAIVEPEVEHELDRVCAALEAAGYRVVEGGHPERCPRTGAVGRARRHRAASRVAPGVDGLIADSNRQHIEAQFGLFDLGDSSRWMRAVVERRQTAQATAKAMEEHHLVVAPVAGHEDAAARLRPVPRSRRDARLFDHMRDVVWVNLLSLPSLALPNGIQLVARRFHEAEAAAAAAAVVDELGPVEIAEPAPPPNDSRGRSMSEVLPKTGFQSPYDVPTPAGAEGWEEMYPYYLLFDPARRDEEEKRFWFYNGMHFPEPMPAFDMITGGSCYQSIGLYQGRVFSIPTVLGIEHRVVNGYVYITSNEVTGPGRDREAARGLPAADRLLLRQLGFAREPLAGRGRQADRGARDARGAEAARARGRAGGDPRPQARLELPADALYDRTLQLYNELNQLHFELLLLAYGAYLTFFQFCQGAFPDMGMQTMTQMIAGYDTTMFRPDDELKALARSALDKGVDGAFTDGRSHEEILAELSESEPGREWIADLESRQHPWFFMSTGDGFYHHHRAWADDPRLPFAAIGGYIRQLGEGRSLDRPKEQLLAERDRIASEYSALLPTDEERVQFDEMLGLCRHVFPHAEGHKFFIEHWGTSLFFNKMREIGQVFVEQGFFEEADDVFFLNIHEVHEALFDLGLAWSGGMPGRGTLYWPPRVARRKEILAKLAEWNPPPALGTVPEVISDPTVQLLWGITADRLHAWAATAGGGDGDVSGYAASPGVVEGVARVVRSVDDIGTVQQDEILVCSVTAPSWGPCLPEDRGRRLRHRRDDVSRGDRRPRVRLAGRCRYRQRNLDDQDRRPGACRRQHRHRDDPELT
jgi:pyruvate,water dikinase